MKKNTLALRAIMGMAVCGALLSGCGSLSDTTTTPTTTNTTTSTTPSVYEYLVYPNQSANDLEVADIYVGPGSLTLVSTSGAATYATPIFVKTHPNNAWVYEANEGAGNINGFLVGETTASLTQLPNGPYASVTGVDSIAINSAGTQLFAAGSTGLESYTINSDGSLTPITGGSIAQALPASPCAMAFTATTAGSFLNVAAGDGSATAAIYTYQVNASGVLTLVSSVSTPGLKFSGVVSNSAGNVVYAALQESSSDGEVVSFTVNTDGTLTQTSVAQDLAEGPGELTLTRTGFLYVGGNAGNLFAFTTDTAGDLTEVAGTPYAIGVPLDFLGTDNTQTLLYGASVDDSLITGYQIQSDGSLTTAANSPYTTSVANPGHFDTTQFSY